MLKTTLRGLLTHKFRVVLTTLAIVLGVALMAGTYVLTDTVTATFDDLFAEATGGIDVQVRREVSFGDEAGFADRASVTNETLELVQAVDGVDAAEPSLIGYAQIIDKDGNAIAPQGPPTLGFSWSESPALRVLEIREGRAPAASGEVVIDARTAREYGLSPGDNVDILLRGPTRNFEIVGVAGFGDADNLAGATVVSFERDTAIEVLGTDGGYEAINVVAGADVSRAELIERIEAAVPEGVEVITNETLAEEQSDAVSAGFEIFETALLAFAGVSLFVGAFIIYNTFSITVAQKTREFGLLRSLGASRRQIVGSVFIEALVISTIASAFGLGFGLLIAIGLTGLFDALGISLPSTSLVLLPRTIIVSFGLGIGITLVSAVSPAIAAGRVSPIEALRGDAGTESESLKRQTVVGAVCAALGGVLLGLGLIVKGDAALIEVAGGAILLFIAVAALGPWIARPVAAGLGAPFAAIGMPGRLGRANAMRNPRRTASTAAGLMVGIALVAFVGIFVQSLKDTTTRMFRETVTADYLVSTDSFQAFSPLIADQVAATPGVTAVAPLRTRPQGSAAKVGDTTITLMGSNSRLDDVADLGVTQGSIDALDTGGLLVHVDEAAEHGWSVGDLVEVEFPSTGTQQVEIVGIYEQDSTLFGKYLLALPTYEANYRQQQDFFLFVATDGASDDARAVIEETLAAYPNVTLETADEFLRQQEEQLDQIFSIVYILLIFAIGIALFGIVTTLALSVFERTREIGLLRAVGMTRRQTRSMVRAESIVVAVFGAALGVVVGVLLGWAVVTALESAGITEFGIPFGVLTGMIVVGAFAGVAASLYPAGRAAKLDVLKAIQAE